MNIEKEYNEYYKKITLFELIEPFYKEIRDIQKRAKESSEWLMKFSATFIGLTFIIASFNFNFTNKLSHNYSIIFFISSLLFIVSISFSFYFWLIIRSKIEVPDININNKLYRYAKEKEIKLVQSFIFNNYEKIKCRINKKSIYLNISIVFFISGLILLSFEILIYFIRILN